jgi:hypothetical protein
MFSWVVLYVPIKSYDLVLKNIIIKHTILYLGKPFYPTQVEQLAYSTQKHLLNMVDPGLLIKL